MQQKRLVNINGAIVREKATRSQQIANEKNYGDIKSTVEVLWDGRIISSAAGIYARSSVTENRETLTRGHLRAGSGRARKLLLRMLEGTYLKLTSAGYFIRCLGPALCL